MRQLYWLLVVPNLLCVLLCAQKQSGQPSPALPFSITISRSSTVAKTGEGVEVRVTLTNTSTRDIDASSFYVDGVNLRYSYAVGESTCELLERKKQRMDGSIRLHTLKPGESIEEGTLVSEACDMSRPGQYTIRLSRATANDPRNNSVKSNVLTVTITP